MFLYYFELSYVLNRIASLLPNIDFVTLFAFYLISNLCFFYKQTTIVGLIELWKILSLFFFFFLIYIFFFTNSFAFLCVSDPCFLLNLPHSRIFSDPHVYALISKVILVIVFTVYVLNLIFLYTTKPIDQIAPEFPIVLGFSFFFILLLQDTYDLFAVYLLLEGIALTSYLLILSVQKSIVSVEATNKYIILTSVSSGFFLFSLSVFFFYTNSLHFQDLDMFLCSAFSSTENYYSLLPVKFSLFLALFALLIKLGVFPGHVWVPDVYEGMPILVLFFFSCVTKIGIFLFFIKLLTTLFFVALPLLQPFLLISSLGSIVFGALGAFNQRRLKRFVAYTSINQTGFMLLGLSCASLSGCLATITYLLIYLPALVLFFTAIIYFSKGSFLGTTFLKDLFFKKYGVSVLYLVFFSVSILSMAGFPPLGGFAAKFGLFNVLLNHAFFFSSITVLLTTVISSFYYLKIIRDIWFCLHKTTIFYNYECYTYTFYAYSQRLRWLHLNWRFSVIAAYLNILLNMLLFLFITCFYLLHNQFIIFCTYFSMSAFDDYFFIIG